MNKKIIIDATFPSETRVVLLDKNSLIEEIEYSFGNKVSVKNNIYLAKITRIEPSLQAAFIDYGNNNSGFLPFSEINPDYFNIPSTDKKDRALCLKKIPPPNITSIDLEEKITDNTLINNSFHKDDILISDIEKMVDEKISSNFNIEAEENEIDHILKSEHNINGKLDTEDSDSKEYKIQEVIKKGQIVLIQATKEERGNKCATFTTYISLAGKYCVLMPNKPMQNGISKKILNIDERKRLKKIISEISIGDNVGSSSIIIRTAGIGRTTLDIKKDYDYLVRLWNNIREATLKSHAPTFIHQENGLILKTIRDMFDHRVQEIIVQGNDAYLSCIQCIKNMLPNHQQQIKLVKEYKGNTPIFTKFAIEDQITKLYQPNVYLSSGGYIVINPTESLIAIDVNSGKSTSERNIEEMAVKINLEAAQEIAKQSKLRELSGLIVIDFIDMQEIRNRKIIERSLKEFFRWDKAKIQISQISAFGLLEMSRQRLRASFLEINSGMCLHCSGKGLIRAEESNAMLILRTIENEVYNTNYNYIKVYAISKVTIYLLNNKKAEISLIEKKYKITISFYIDKDATADSFSIEKLKLPNQKKYLLNTIKQPIVQNFAEILESNQTKEEGKKVIGCEKIVKNKSNGKNEFITKGDNRKKNKKQSK